MLKTNSKRCYLILLVCAGTFILLATIALALYFAPSKQTVTKIQPVTVPQAAPIKITSLDVDLTYYGNQEDFEDLLDDPENPDNSNFSIDSVSFNEDDQDLDVPNNYLNTDDEDQTLTSLLTQPHYVGQTYYNNAQHPAVKVTVKRANVFGKQLKAKTTEHNVWPKKLKVGQTVNDQTFTSNNHQQLNNYENTSYFTNPDTNQNTIIHVEGNYKYGKYPRSWTGNYRITVDSQTHKLTWTNIDNN